MNSEKIAKLRALRGQGMVSAVGEYTPDELWDALDEIERLRTAIQQTLDENGHLADGDVCTLILLKLALETPNAKVSGASDD